MINAGFLTRVAFPDLQNLDKDWFMAPETFHASEIVQFTIELARTVGVLLQQRPDALEVTTKSTVTDVVTQMDQAAESALVSAISEQFPDDSILGEEGTSVAGTTNFQWVLDPLDGTVNYLYHLPAWAISIARVNLSTGLTQVGVVHAPDLDRTYWASHGQGAHLEHDEHLISLHASECVTLEQALIGTGFGYEKKRRQAQARVLNSLLPQVRDIRRIGSCAIDLCLVAEGALDGFYERGVNPWDHSAGALIAREAGAVVSGLHGHQESDEMIVVANPMLHPQLVQLLESVSADSDSAQR